MSNFLEYPTDVLREKFILYRLGQRSRFGRVDIEDWLDQQLNADAPDCVHKKTVDSTCLWCRLSRDCLFLFDDMETMVSLFKTSLTPVLLNEHTPRRFCWDGIVPFLTATQEQNEYFVGRDRFVIAKGDSGIYILEMQTVSNDCCDPALTIRPFAQDSVLANCALADVLMGEWIRYGSRAEQARTVLVSMLQLEVGYERSNAGADFDRAVAVSEDGKNIIKASWIVVYNRDSKQMFFHYPNWFVNNKLRIDPKKKRVHPNKYVPIPVVGSNDSFIAVATCVKDFIVATGIDTHQVVLSIGRKKEPILFVPTTHFEGSIPVGVCSIQF